MEKGGESLGSLQPTSNQTGFDFGQPTYKIDEWIAAYDGKHPLLDLGCGLGACYPLSSSFHLSKLPVLLVQCFLLVQLLSFLLFNPISASSTWPSYHV
jgi:hypothetical protein